MTNPAHIPDYEWPHPVRVIDLEHAVKVAITATSAQCKAVAQRLEIPAIASMTAHVTIIPQPHTGRYHVQGILTADVTQLCIRTGMAFDSQISSDIEGFFGDKAEIVSFAQAKKKRMEAEGDQPNFVDEAEDPEPLDDGCIDVGELAVQCLSLALDPYPVSPDAPLPVEVPMGEPVRVDNPFAILGQLREFMDDEK